MQLRYRSSLLTVLAVGGLAAAAVPAAPAVAEPSDTRVVAAAGPDGVEVFTGDVFGDLSPLSEQVATALAAAQERVEQNPDDLAGAYLDRATGEVVTQATTTAGVRTAASLPAGVTGRGRARQVANSHATLTRIQHEAIGLSPTELPGSDTVYGTFVQEEKNRVVVEAKTVTPALRKALADRYGVSRVAIHLTPDVGLPSADYGGRQNDSSPFLGGAYINVPGGYWCSTAFAWRNGGYHGMLTAGHCVSNGGTVTSGTGARIGTVISNNWNDGVGTVRYPGDPYDRGDLGLIQIAGGAAASDARVYVYGVNSTDWRNVITRYNRKSIKGDSYCTSGAKTGELCGWTAQETSYDVKYDDGEVARNVTRGTKSGSCLNEGDSGGAVYYTDSNGQVHAKGVTSGGASGCTGFFTEITDAVNALPGDVATR
ncbi:S1 family peptidase [Planosporangium sp. 12N6]|uniref:S1 family peptidase n=1 Tax=Planosporangium spinosum TaxID=3402278 RepID=UPI003CF45B91